MDLTPRDPPSGVADEPGPDVLTLLVLQHRRLEALMRTRVLAVLPDDRRRTLGGVLDAWAVQLRAEADAFHPVVEALPPRGPADDAALASARRAHQDLRALALRLLLADAAALEADQACHAFLEVAVAQHRRAERELFPSVAARLTLAQREALGTRVAAVETRLRRHVARGGRQRLWLDLGAPSPPGRG